MTITRRSLIKAGLAVGTALSVPSVLRAQSTAGGKVVRWAKNSPTIFDPYTTTDVNTADYALGVYDMLFGLDSNYMPQPQMVGAWEVSEDKRTYNFTLRDALSWHDQTPVTAADCVASLRRWLQAPGGELVSERVREVSELDEKNLSIALKEPFGVLIDQLAQAGSYAAFMMRKQDAERAPSEAVTTHIGSGPFRFNEEFYVPGASIAFDRYENYVPRGEAPDGLAGAKIAHVDRVIWSSLPDPQTAFSALQAGEIDLMVEPPADLFPMIESDRNLALENLYKSGYNYLLRMNCLQKPFDNVKVRQAVLHLINQDAFLRVINPSQKGNRNVTSLFGTDTAYSNDTNTDWFQAGGNPERAKQLLQESGYAGERVVILDPTDWPEAHDVSLFLASELRKIGMNVDLASTDWPGLVARRAKKDSVENGGWSIFVTSVPDFSIGTPISSAYTTMSGDAGWFGWPESAEYESIRLRWPDVTELAEQQELARQMQQIWWDYVGWVYLGQVPTMTAFRNSLTGMMGIPSGRLLMWNMQKA